MYPLTLHRQRQPL